MEVLELFQRLSVALAIGLLIGLERGWKMRDEAEGHRAAGFRTHALGGLLGGVWGALALRNESAGLIALALAFSTYSAAVILFRYRETQHDQTFGMTTVVAAMLTFALGAFAVLGDMRAAAAAGVATAGLLALKNMLHGWLKKLSWIELQSALMLLAMSFILLPLLPKRAIDPWGAINPFELWFMTILIAVISFAGYAAIKALGPGRGVLFSGIAGGLASSTAVTLTMTRLAKLHPEQRDTLLGGVAVAGATMIARVLVLTGVLNAAVFERLIWPLGFGGVALAAIAAYWMRAGEVHNGGERVLALSNPFELSTVLKFGALLTVVGVLAKGATKVAGDFGAYAVAALSGIADVDAITLAMARLGAGELGPDAAAIAIALAVGVNTCAKAALGWVTGGYDAGWRLAAASGLAILAGIAGLGVRALT